MDFYGAHFLADQPAHAAAVLKFNSVPEWRECYINYPLLKKLILAASTAEYHEGYEGMASTQDEEAGRSPLLSAQPSLSRSLSVTMTHEQREKEFLEALDNELAKIIRFYRKKEAEVSAKFEELSMMHHHAEGISSSTLEQLAGQLISSRTLKRYTGVTSLATAAGLAAVHTSSFSN